MKITNVKEVHYNYGLIDVILDVEFEDNIAYRWELVEPEIQAVYRQFGDYRLDYLELLDSGMNVHGFEFTDEEKREIVDFIERKVIAKH